MGQLLSAGDWIALVGSLLTVAAGYGAARAQSRADREKLEELRRSVHDSNVDQGRRLGELEGWRQAVIAVEMERRRTRTGALPLPDPEDQD